MSTVSYHKINKNDEEILYRLVNAYHRMKVYERANQLQRNALQCSDPESELGCRKVLHNVEYKVFIALEKRKQKIIVNQYQRKCYSNPITRIFNIKIGNEIADPFMDFQNREARKITLGRCVNVMIEPDEYG